MFQDRQWNWYRKVKEILLIHVVESSKRYTWFEKLFAHLETQGFHQALVTLEPKGEINELLFSGKIAVRSPRSKRAVISSIQAIDSICKLRKEGYTNLLFLHGHRAAIVGAVAARIAKLDFAIVHHVQPRYFQLLKTRHPLRGSIHQLIYRYYVSQAKVIQSLSQEVTKSLTALG